MSAEPRGSHERGKPLPVESIKRLVRAYEESGRKLKPACRKAGVTRHTGRKYLGLSDLPDLDI